MNCPFCSQESTDLSADMVRCENCGNFYRVRGPKTEQDTPFRDANPPEDVLPPVWSLREWFVDACPGLFRVVSVVVILLLLCFSVISVTAMVFMLQLGVYVTAVFVAGAGITCYVASAAILCSGEISSLPSMFTAMTQRGTALFWNLAILPFLLALLAIGLVARFK